MKKALLLLLLCVLLSGCSPSNTYISVEPHQEQSMEGNPGDTVVSNAEELRQAMEELVERGEEQGIIFVPNYDSKSLETDLDRIHRDLMRIHPVASYAVEEISYELGTNSGQRAVALNIQYLYSKSEIRSIEQISTMDQAKKRIETALNDCSPGLVMRISDFRETDFAQFVEDYMEENPQRVMELPVVSANVYPGYGLPDQVVELKFTYQTSRDTLRSMQEQVRRIFDASVLYVSMDAAEHEKYTQLYAFLMERFDYQVETSITPAYSLLRHGVGNSETFAVVFAAICHQNGLECRVISGTRDGEAWYWNLLREGDQYYHVDLLRSAQSGGMLEQTDGQMSGYVWDYSRFPVAEDIPEPTEPADIPVDSTDPATEPAEETVPQEAEPETTESTEPD